MMDNIRKLLPMKNVYMHGWVNRETLERAWSTSSIWLYPCIFKETFCISALEAAISRTLVITNNLAALNETVGNRGIIVSGNTNTISWMNQVYEILKNININNYDYLLESNYNYAINNMWEIKAKEMLKLFDMDNHDARNTFLWTATLMNKM
jgi:glycosyltransferase involved in cell wall biosynthesis